MTITSTNLRVTRTPLAHLASAVALWFEETMLRRSRRAQIDALHAKSDAELGAMGLNRD